MIRFFVFATSFFICTTVGALIGEATAISGGHHHNAFQVGVLVGAASGIVMGALVATIWEK